MEDEMLIKQVLKSVSVVVIGAAAAFSAALGATSAAQVAGKNTPGFVAAAQRLGVTDATRTIDVVVWLNIRNRAELDKLAGELYDRASANYHQWITAAQFANRFAPTPEDAATVAGFLTSNGLSLVEKGPANMYVRARGTVANVNKAFQVRLNNFQFKGQTLYANTTDPVVAGAAGTLTAAVYGLHNLPYTHPNATRTVTAGATSGGSAVGGAKSMAMAPVISSDCFSGRETEKVENDGNGFPHVTLTGNGYAAKSGSLGGCGYTPPEIQKAYKLTNLYADGFDGAGQTIVIIDWCGSPTIRADANTFSRAYGLPPLTTANFQIINSSTPPTCGAPDPEINIDVEWSHAIAPGANIDLVVPPSASFSDVDTAEYFAIINHLGNVISGSYGSEELYDALAEVQTENLLNEIAAVQGISANFSSGDSGDFTFDVPEFSPASVSVPADSPYATAVGGISLALKANGTIDWQAGWGTNVTPIDSGGFVLDPPTEYSFFNYGSGGGPSAVFSLPAFQAGLGGSNRLVPDVSWLADPFTGGVIVISEPFQSPPQVYEVYGGTSLACPMFSALWAIANQAAGGTLGQAAQYLYTMPPSTIMDVTPVTSAANVTARYKESPTVTDAYTAAELAGPLENTTEFVTAIWNYPLNQDTIYVISFGTDSGLVTATGWDNVTGVGVPNGKEFAEYFMP
jgi:subtilase family serine protease